MIWHSSQCVIWIWLRMSCLTCAQRGTWPTIGACVRFDWFLLSVCLMGIAWGNDNNEKKKKQSKTFMEPLQGQEWSWVCRIFVDTVRRGRLVEVWGAVKRVVLSQYWLTFIVIVLFLFAFLLSLRLCFLLDSFMLQAKSNKLEIQIVVMVFGTRC